MATRPGAVGAGILLAVLHLGCQGDRDVRSQANLATLSPTSITLLRESDTSAVGQPFDFAVLGSDGSVLVSDAFSGRVMRFDRSGDLIGVVGAPGQGPGEFVTAGTILPLDAERIGVFDMQRTLWQFFDLSTNSYTGSLRTHGFVYGADRLGDTLWMGSMRVGSHETLERWVVGDTALETESLPGAYPPAFDEAPAYPGLNHEVYLARLDGTLIQGFGGRNELYVLDADGEVKDTIRHAVRIRRGVPANVVEIFNTGDLETRAESLSLLAGLHATKRGQLALVHVDLDLDGRPPNVLVRSSAYVSIIDRHGNGTCIDVPVPNSSAEERALFDFRGDTLFALQRRIEGSRVLTEVYAFPLPVEACSAQ